MMSNSSSGQLVSFGGHTLRVHFDSTQIADAFRTHLRHCQVQAGDELIAEFYVSVTESTFSISVDGSVLFPGLTFDLTLQFLLTEVISRLVAVCERGLVIHAAALALDGNAVILSAQGGSGKSTLAAWLTTDGMQYLTDEVIEVPLHPSTSLRTENAIYTFPRSIFLKSGSAFVWQKRLTQTDSSHFLRFSDDAAWIDPELFNSVPPVAQAVPRLLVFPRYEPGAQLQSQKLTKGEALFHVLQNSTNARNLPRHGMDAATQLAQQVTAYSLTYSDLPAASEWIQTTLSESPRE